MTTTHTTKRAIPADTYIGQRIRERRIIMGISQEKLANALGLTFQQIQKYEYGTNRISAGRLHDVTKALGVDITYFYKGLNQTTENAFPEILPCNRLVMDTCASLLALPHDLQQQTANIVKAFTAASAALLPPKD